MHRPLTTAVLAVALALPGLAHADACTAASLEGAALTACQKLLGPCKYQRGSAKTKCEAKAVERAARAATPTDSSPPRSSSAERESGVVSSPSPEAEPAEPASEPVPAEPAGPTWTEAEQKEDAEALFAAAQRIAELGNRSGWELSDSVSQKVGENVPLMLEKMAKQGEAQATAAVVRPVFDSFTARYTADKEEWQSASGAIDNAFRGVVDRVGDAHVAVEVGLETISEGPTKNARRCIEILEMSTRPDYLANLHELYRVKAIVEARAMLDVCPGFDPADAEIAAKMEALRPEVEQTLATYKAEEMAAIKERTWSGSVGSVSAGSPASLAASGLSYLRGQRDWGGDSRGTQVHAVSVRGDWFVAERNIFGAPTRYGLPVQVAITNDGSMEGTAQVFDLSLVTSSATQAPPFDQYRVGNTWLILRERVP